MFKLISALWFSLLSATAFIVIVEYMALQKTDVEWTRKILTLFVVALFASPWGYYVGSKISVDKTKLLNGLPHSVYIGILVTLFASLSISVFMILYNAVDLPLSEALLGGLGFFVASILIVGPITFSIGIIGSIILWLSLTIYQNHLTRQINMDR